MAETILHPTKDNFDTMLQENKVVLVDFWADWCGPCKMLAPVIDSLAKEYNGRAAFAKINVDEQSDLATRFGIMSIPTVIILKTDRKLPKKLVLNPPILTGEFWKTHCKNTYFVLFKFAGMLYCHTGGFFNFQSQFQTLPQCLAHRCSLRSAAVHLWSSLLQSCGLEYLYPAVRRLQKVQAGYKRTAPLLLW